MKLTLTDGNAFTSYNFTITITNTAPAFIVVPPATQTLALNSASPPYQFEDLENNPINITVSDETNSGTPDYIQYTASSMTIKATNYSSIGRHTLKVVMSDG
jgi:hypothetical protein